MLASHVVSNMNRLHLTLAWEFSDFRILTKLVFKLGIPPTWRRVMIMTSMTSLIPYVYMRWNNEVKRRHWNKHKALRHVGGILSANTHKFDNSDAKVFSQSVYFNVVHNYTHSSLYANASLPLRRSCTVLQCFGFDGSSLVWFSAADWAGFASFKAHYNIVSLTYLPW